MIFVIFSCCNQSYSSSFYLCSLWQTLHLISTMWRFSIAQERVSKETQAKRISTAYQSHKFCQRRLKPLFLTISLSNNCENFGLFPAALVAYRKSLGCADALWTISHNLQMSLYVGQDSYIVQLDFTVAFDKVSLSGLIYKTK